MCKNCCIGRRALSPNLHATTPLPFVDLCAKARSSNAEHRTRPEVHDGKLADDRLWHSCDMPRSGAEVRFRGQSGPNHTRRHTESQDTTKKPRQLGHFWCM